MACATLKRTLDFDPLHSPGTSPKRRRCSPIITPTTPTSKASLQQSPFSPVTPRISPGRLESASVFRGESLAEFTHEGQLAAHISQEWRRLKRRKRLEDSYAPDQASHSQSPAEHSHITSQMLLQHQAAMHSSSPARFVPPSMAAGLAFPGLAGCSAPSTSTGLPCGSPPQSQTKDQPMFTLKQVILICERMLKEQESRIREEYDKVLTNKLAEQYDAFVKFNQDQIQRRFSSSSMSYVS